MWWIAGLVVLLLPLVYLLFAPFFIEIDTNRELYRFRFHKMAYVDIVFKNDSIYLRYKILGWQREYDLLEPKEEAKKEAKVKPASKSKSAPDRKILRRIWKVVQSFQLKQCYITFDTGNMPLNGILYPWFFMLSWKTGKTVQINFWDETTVVLQVQNSIARMIWAFIKA